MLRAGSRWRWHGLCARRRPSRRRGRRSAIFERMRGAYEAGAFASRVAGESFGAGFTASAWSLAARALELLGDARDVAWVRARSLDIGRREAEDPANPGMPMLSPERLELLDVIDGIEDDEAAALMGNANGILPRLKSREEMIAARPALRARGGAAGRLDDSSSMRSTSVTTTPANSTARFGEKSRRRVASSPRRWLRGHRWPACRSARASLLMRERTLRHVEELVPRLTRESLFLLQYSGALDEEWCAIGGSVRKRCWRDSRVWRRIRRRRTAGRWRLSSARWDEAWRRTVKSNGQSLS